MSFPFVRLRRLRRKENLRRLVRETDLSVDDLIQPLFVCPGKNIRKTIESMPGVFQLSVDEVIKECKEIEKLKIPGVILFGIPERKDEIGSDSLSPEGIIPQAIRAIKKECPSLLVITDVCLCEYTSHGHCGIIKDGEVDNDATLKVLAQQALNYVKAGADIIAPSDMMDGRVKAVRNTLDENGFYNTPIISYAAKYFSAFYSPFREAAESAPKFGDRKGYQMDPANSDEAMREIKQDLEEGADIIMIKPALAYLDIIYRAKEEFKVPVAAFNVSGEYSMIKAAAEKGWIDEEKVMFEILLSIKRAGADFIFTYFAKEIAKRI
ncbi:MAG: porphobilinogen synthase [candidate division Zixibacteria bacterium]|nr:porphobilinogen synthase [candidate division Zixibacteria bacterium]